MNETTPGDENSPVLSFWSWFLKAERMAPVCCLITVCSIDWKSSLSASYAHVQGKVYGGTDKMLTTFNASSDITISAGKQVTPNTSLLGVHWTTILRLSTSSDGFASPNLDLSCSCANTRCFGLRVVIVLASTIDTVRVPPCGGIFIHGRPGITAIDGRLGTYMSTSYGR